MQYSDEEWQCAAAAVVVSSLTNTFHPTFQQRNPQDGERDIGKQTAAR